MPSARYPLHGTGLSCAVTAASGRFSRQTGGARGVRSMRPGYALDARLILQRICKFRLKT